jgi:hypothetical protein
MPYDSFSQEFLAMLDNPTKIIFAAMVSGALLGFLKGLRKKR